MPTWMYAALASLGAALYLPTLASGPLWLDPSEFIAGAFSLGVVHPPAHPTYILLAKAASLVPLGGIAFRIHLLSTLCGIASACVLASLTAHIGFRVMEGRWTADSDRDVHWFAAVSGVLAGAALLCTRACWEQSVRAEVYTFNLLCTLGLLWLAVQWLRTGGARPLIAFVTLTGLALGNHHYLVFFAVVAPLLVLLSRADGRRRLVGPAAIAAVLLGFWALGVYAYVPLRAATWPVIDWGHPTDLARFWDVLTAATFQGALDPAARGATLADNLLLAFGLTTSQVGGPAIALVLLGWCGALVAAPRAGALLVGAFFFTLLTKAILPVDPSNPDDHGYFALSVAMCCAGLGLSLAAVVASIRWPHVQRVAAAMVIGLAAVSVAIGASPQAYDQSNDVSAEALVVPTLNGLPSDSVLCVQYYGLFFNSWYSQIVDGRRPDVAVVQQTFDVHRYEGEWYLQSLERHHPALAPVTEAVRRDGEFPRAALLSLPRPVFVQPVVTMVPDAADLAPVGLVRRLGGGAAKRDHTVRDAEDWSHRLAVAGMYGAPKGEAVKVLHWMHFLQTVTALRQGQGRLADLIRRRWTAVTPLGPPGALTALVERLWSLERRAAMASENARGFAMLQLEFMRRLLADLDYTELLSGGGAVAAEETDG